MKVGSASLWVSISAAWQQATQSFLHDRRERQVWKTHDRQGELHWSVYDPTNDQIVSLVSEAEARIWLDQYHG